MELQQLRYFLMVADTQHMTKAASKLHIAQPALTQCIHRLEDELGISLFDHVGRRIRLNENGKLLQEQLLPIVKAIDAIPSFFAKKDQATEPVRINIRSGSELLTRILIAYRNRYPEKTFTLLQDAGEEKSDIIIETERQGRTMDGEDAVLEEEIFIAVPKSSPFFARRSIALQELSALPFIAFSPEKPLRILCDRFCAQAGFKAKIVFESDHPAIVRNLIEAGMGVGFWPAFSWGDFTGDHAVLIPIGEPHCRRRLVIRLSRKASRNPDARKFQEFARTYLASLGTQKIP